MLASMQAAVLNTLAYADIFDYPLTVKEIHKWLIPEPSVLSVSLSQQIGRSQGYYFLAGRRHLVQLRQSRHRTSLKKLRLAKRVGDWLKLIPFINLVGITGALAMNNSESTDDIDLMIITSHHTLWLTRPLVVTFMELLGVRRHPSCSSSVANRFCLNLWLDTTALSVPKSRRNLYTAHEVAQVKPLWSRGHTYQEFLSANRWINRYLPNIPIPKIKTLVTDNWLLITLINRLAFRLQLWYMKPRLTHERVSLHAAFFHPRNTAKLVLRRFNMTSIVTLDHLYQLRASIHFHNKTIVLATGIFDLLHSEHQKFLRQAKATGDILLLGVETDSRTQTLKGSDRPLHPLRLRLANLAQLHLADYLFALPENFGNSKIREDFILRLRPHLLAVSEHTPNFGDKQRIMKLVGGQVLIVYPHHPGVSTTQLVDKLKKQAKL